MTGCRKERSLDPPGGFGAKQITSSGRARSSNPRFTFFDIHPCRDTWRRPMPTTSRRTSFASIVGSLIIGLQCATLSTSSVAYTPRQFIFVPQQSYSLVSSRIDYEGGGIIPPDCDEFDNCLPRPPVELINSSSSTELVTSITSNTNYSASSQKASINLSMLPSAIRIYSQVQVDGNWFMHAYYAGSADATWKGDFEVTESGKYEISFSGTAQGNIYFHPGEIGAPTVSVNLSSLGTSIWSSDFAPLGEGTRVVKQVLDLDSGMYQLSFASHAAQYYGGPYKVYSGLTLNPIPEPATWSLLALGLAALLLQHRTHRKA